MRNLLKLLYKYNYVILFLILQGFSLLLIFNNSTYHHARFFTAARSFTGSVYEKMSNFKAYIGLKEENYKLAQENLQLKNQIEQLRKLETVKTDTLVDTTKHQLYSYFLAKIVNNSVNKQYNYITINRGSRDGVKPDMGVVTSDGIVGIVLGVSENFSTVISVLNMNFSVSAKIKKNGYFGFIAWDGISSRYCLLNDIAQHVKLEKGDTIVTSSYSGIFPENIPIGKISAFEVSGGNFYKIKIELFNDFRKLNYVTLVDNLYKEEQKSLENKIKND